MAVSGQLCRVAEGLSYHAKTLAHRPPPSPQKSDTCANPVQKFRRAARFNQGDILDSYKSVPPENLAWSRPYTTVYRRTSSAYKHMHISWLEESLKD
jgi:hypothetical protein